MAYDLPFMSKSRRDIGKLPGEQRDPFLPSPMEPMTPMSSPSWANIPEDTPDWLRPGGGFAAEPLFAAPTPPTRQPMPLPDTPPVPIPTAEPRPTPDQGVVELAPSYERELERESMSRKWGEKVEDAPHPESPLVNTQVNNPWGSARDYRPDPSNWYHTGVPVIDEGIGYFKGVGHFGLSFLQGPLFWPEEIAAQTAIESLQAAYKYSTDPFNLDYGDIPTIFTEGPFAAKTKFDQLPAWQQIVGVGALTGGVGGILKAASRTSTRKAVTTSAVASGANLSERHLISSGKVVSQAVPPATTDDAITSAAALDNAVVDLVQKKIDELTGTPILDGRNILGLRGDIALGKVTENIKTGMARGIMGAARHKFDPDAAGQDMFNDTLLPIYRHAEESRLRLESLANDTAAQIEAIAYRYFPANEKNLIPALSGIDKTLPKGEFNHAPSLQDVAARLDIFEAALTKTDPRSGAMEEALKENIANIQRQTGSTPTAQQTSVVWESGIKTPVGNEKLDALLQIKELLRPWKELLDDVGVNLGSRRDVTGKGFYIPRGSAKEINKELEELRNTRRRKEGTSRAGFEEAERFPSMAGGVNSNYEYADIAATIRSYIHDAGDRSITKNMADQLKRTYDKDGKLLTETAAMRLERNSGDLKRGMRNTKSSIASAVRTSIRQAMSEKEMETTIDILHETQEKLLAGTAKAQERKGLTLARYKVQAEDRNVAHQLLVEATAERDVMLKEIRKLGDELTTAGRKLDKTETRWLQAALKLEDASIPAAKSVEVSPEGKQYVSWEYLDDAGYPLDINDQLNWDYLGKPVQPTQPLPSYIKRAEDIIIKDPSAQSNPMYLKLARLDPAKLTAVARRTQQYFTAVDRVQRMHGNTEKLGDIMDKLSDRIEDLTERRILVKELSDIERENKVTSGRRKRLAESKDRSSRIAEAELKMLEREKARTLRVTNAALTKTGRRGQKLNKAREKNTALIERLQDRIDGQKERWNAAIQASRTGPSNRVEIRLEGMIGYDFPEAMARSMNDAIAKNMPKDENALWRTVRSMNSWYLGFKATGDDGVLMIQGLLGMAGTRGAKGGAYGIGGRDFVEMMKWHGQAWVDPRTLGSFLLDFNNKTRKAGRLLSHEWERYGVRVGGAQTEFSLRAPAEKIPVLGRFARASNRAFGYYGDSRRLMWADDMLEEELSKNRALKEIIESGDMERIADVANAMTGWSKKRTAGSVGELALLAPRFLQARLETTWKATQGIVPAHYVAGEGFKKGNRIDHRMARRTMLRTVAHVAAMTEMVNRMQGRETDWRPVVRSRDGDLRWNSNFMRMHIGYLNRDVSLMGTYDSLARLLVSMGTADFGAIRGLSSGVVQNMWDFIQGSDWKGRDVGSTKTAITKRLLSNFMPMAAEDGTEGIAQAIVSAKEKDIQGVVAGTGGALLEVLGTKSGIMSLTDIKQDLTNELIANASDEELGRLTKYRQMSGYDKLSGHDYLYDYLPDEYKHNIMLNQDVIDKTEKLADPPLGSIRVQLNNAVSAYENKKTEGKTKLEQNIIDGYQGEDLRGAIQAYQSELRIASNTVFYGELEEYLDRMEEPNKLDMFRERFYNVPLEYKNKSTDNLDFDKREEEREKILLEAEEALGDAFRKEDFTRRYSTGNTKIDATLEQYDKDMDKIRSLWGLEDSLVEGMPASIQKLWSDYRDLDKVSAQIIYTNNEVIRNISREITESRLMLRELDSTVDAAYMRQGYSTKPQSDGGMLQALIMRDRADLNRAQANMPPEEPDTTGTPPPIPEEVQPLEYRFGREVEPVGGPTR